MILYIMRGASGSGKSTEAKKLKGYICSTDNFFIDVDTGESHFNPSMLGLYHQANQLLAKALMKKGEQNVIIDNTNTTWKEIEPYYLTGKECGYEIIFVEPDNDVWKEHKKGMNENDILLLAIKLHGRCRHGNTMSNLLKQIKRWEFTEDFQL